MWAGRRRLLGRGVGAFGVLGVVALALLSPGAPAAERRAPPPLGHEAVVAAYGQLPLRFEANRGQTDPVVEYLARGPGYALFLTPEEAVLALRPPPAPAGGAGGMVAADTGAGTAGAGAVLRLRLEEAHRAPTRVGLDEQPGSVNYFVGNDPAQWHTDVPTYGRVQYTGVYAGIDLVYYGSQQALEYDFVVAPGADPGQIALAFEGAEAVTVDTTGTLRLALSGGVVEQRPPRVYQEADGQREPVAGAYSLRADGRVGFSLGPYDTQRPLVIDPVLVYSTYLGGSGQDFGNGIAVDGQGQAYITGRTQSANFPLAGPLACCGALQGTRDAFVSKLSAAGNTLVYSTYLGGSGNDEGNAIAVDGQGQAYVTGNTISANFPLVNPLACCGALQGSTEAFVTKLNAAGNTLIYSTYLGGSALDTGRGIAVDGQGQAYVAGATSSGNFPLVSPLACCGALQGPQDAFVTKLSGAGNTLVYSTYLGGSSDDFSGGIAVDGQGQAYVAGATSSGNFPLVSPLACCGALQGLQDAFVSRLNATGTTLIYSTYLGGSALDEGRAIAVDGLGQAYVTGESQSANFPLASPLTCCGALQGPSDAFVSKLNIPGDFNGDGFVDIRDYGVWRQNFGQTNCGNPADGDGNCLVDIRDYGIWRLHFGEGTPPDRRPGAALPAGVSPAPQGTPGPAPLGSDPAVVGSGAPHEPYGSGPMVPIVPLVGGLLGLGGLAGWCRRRPPGRD